jgi:predicted membrane chloride channel (bestrophin family)
MTLTMKQLMDMCFDSIVFVKKENGRVVDEMTVYPAPIAYAFMITSTIFLRRVMRPRPFSLNVYYHTPRF